MEISYCHYARMEQGKRNMSIQMLFALMDFPVHVCVYPDEVKGVLSQATIFMA